MCLTLVWLRTAGQDGALEILSVTYVSALGTMLVEVLVNTS